MRRLIAILGVLAMLVALSGPVTALSRAPCADVSMAKMAMSDDAVQCQALGKSCPDTCSAAECHNPCGTTAPFVRANPDSLSSPPLAAGLLPADGEQPLGTISPFDGPPPRS